MIFCQGIIVSMEKPFEANILALSKIRHSQSVTRKLVQFEGSTDTMVLKGTYKRIGQVKSLDKNLKLTKSGASGSWDS